MWRGRGRGLRSSRMRGGRSRWWSHSRRLRGIGEEAVKDASQTYVGRLKGLVIVRGPLVEGREVEIEFFNYIVVFAFCPCDGSRIFPALATQFRRGPFMVFPGFLISRSHRQFDASCCVVEGHLEEVGRNIVGHFPPNVSQTSQVGGGRRNSPETL